MHSVARGAPECILQACVKNFTAGQKNGKVTETLASVPYTNDSVAAQRVPVPQNSCGTGNDFVIQPLPDGPQYKMNGCIGWLLRPLVFLAGHIAHGSGVQPNDKTVSEAVFEAVNGTRYDQPFGVADLMSNLANSLTREMRLVSHNVSEGTATSMEIYVHISWPWMALPACVVVLATAFLALVMRLSRRSGLHAWKTSAMATMFHGLHDRRDLSFGNTLDVMADAADEIAVRLALTERGWLLMSV